MASRQVPVTLISGFRGAGKTAVAKHLKKVLAGRRAVFLSDAPVANEDDESDLWSEIESAVESEAADVIVIETPSDAEPFFVAEDLTVGFEDEPPPRGIRVDTLVTVVDASSFLKDVMSRADLVDVFDEAPTDDDRTVAEVLIEQIEFADVIVLNKIDLIDKARFEQTESLLSRLNPRAKILRSVEGNIDPSEVIGTGLFELEETDDGAGWLAELQGEFDSSDDTRGITSFTYLERRPFHPIRFNELLGDFDIRGLVRAKGSLWVASRHHEIGVWSLAGLASTLNYGGAWFAATPTREWPTDERERADIMSEWVPPFGDRRQEIAFIGIGMNEQEIRQRLNAALLTAEEMKNGPDGWFSLPDPLPDWHGVGDQDAY